MSFEQIIVVTSFILATQNVDAYLTRPDENQFIETIITPRLCDYDSIFSGSIQNSTSLNQYNCNQNDVNETQTSSCNPQSLWTNITTYFWKLVETQAYHQHHYPAINR